MTEKNWGAVRGKWLSCCDWWRLRDGGVERLIIAIEQARGDASKSGTRESGKAENAFLESFDNIHFVIQSNPTAPISMKTHWFKRFGWFYVPTSIPGISVWFLSALFCLTVFRAVDRHSHSAADTLYGVFPFFVCTFLLVDWIGGRTADKGAAEV